MTTEKESPYLRDPERLNNIIAAIQVMGTYKFYKLDIEKWAQRIQGVDASADYWKIIFKDHPEFFRIDTTGQKASLVWRRSHPKLYDVDQEKKIPRDEYISLDTTAKKRITRTPLDPKDIEALISTAIQLHSRAIEHKKEKRWWVPSVISASSALLGVILGVVLSAIIKGCS